MTISERFPRASLLLAGRLAGLFAGAIAMGTFTAQVTAATAVETASSDASSQVTKHIEDVIVSRTIVVDRLKQAGSGSGLARDGIELVRAEHPHELLIRFPGVLVSRGSGEEHLTAIRSAVLSGTGSCGAFLFMEDGIPIRPHGFCNANGLFEGLSELAGRVEVVRGPTSALFGGNALHGAINIQLPDPHALRTPQMFVEAGRWGFGQAQIALPWHNDNQYVRLDLLGTRTEGFRDHTGFGEQKLSLVHEGVFGDWSARNTLALTNLNQETGGFVLGRNAYRHTDLAHTNPNPEAFRDAWSGRVASRWNKDALTITGYARRSQMAFLQHFLLGQPLEQNGQTSAGAQAEWRDVAFDSRLSWHVGLQGEWSNSYVKETQAKATPGTGAAAGIRPVGTHYDYDVKSWLAAAFYDGDLAIADGFALVHSFRLERLHYDYVNHASNGNLRDNGKPCAFGGCLYNRVPDRNDSFGNTAARIGMRYQPLVSTTLRLVAANGFRPPQTTELYRLQRGQNAADLKSERLTSFEAGWSQRWRDGLIDSDIVLFHQDKRHVILRDSAGFNVSDGKTRGDGVEWALYVGDKRWPLRFELTASYARHKYDFNRNIAGGEVIRKGNAEDTAPRKLGSARLIYAPLPTITTELEMEYQGEYFLDATNTAKYAGHKLLNLRGTWQVTPQVELFARVMNLTDRQYADRGDIAFGSYRYFPGEPLRAFVGVQAKL